MPQSPVTLGCTPRQLRKRVRQAQADKGCARICRRRLSGRRSVSLRAEVFELRRANEILKSASVFFAKELDVDRTR